MEKTTIIMECNNINFAYEVDTQDSREAINELIALPHILHANNVVALHCGALSVNVEGVVKGYEDKLHNLETTRKAYESGEIWTDYE